MTTSVHSFRTPAEAAQWLRENVSGHLHTDSRRVKPGDGFIAWPGAATDGRAHVHAAIAAGATACLVEQSGVEAFGFTDGVVANYAGLKSASGLIAAAYFDQPSQALQTVAVTGTNGKTSTAWWLGQALSRVGRRCGVVGTLGIGEPGAMVHNGLTTPDPVLLQAQLRAFVDSGFAACAIEASSIGIREHRLDGMAINVAVLTNFTQDHLDYHGSMAAYWSAKKALFGWPGLSAAVINVDDATGRELADELAGTALDVWTCSCSQHARLRASNIRYTEQGLTFDVVEGPASLTMHTAMVGHFNVANLLGVLASMRALGVALVHAVQACTALLPVPGRMECVATARQPMVVIDYAHTPDALEKVLGALRPIAASRGGQLWCVFGCGGERDNSKRVLMGAAAERLADRVVITNDNPRREDPQRIAHQILAGLNKPMAAHTELDRAQAIALALHGASANDVVLVAGKGHENYQDVNGQRLVFSDRDAAERALASRGPLVEQPT